MKLEQRRLEYELRWHRIAGVKRLPASRIAGAASPVTDSAPDPGRSEAGGASEPAVLERTERAKSLDLLVAEVQQCRACKLCEHRTHAVPGEGSLDPPILFIGEGPGADEDRTGRPFVGRAGQLLDKMIGAIGLEREQVYIANIVKCRPPQNRTPEFDEVKNCRQYLDRQIELLRPKLICTLGLPATRALVPGVQSISRARGIATDYGSIFGAIPLVPTFHPAYLLRNPAAKRDAWKDLKLVARLALGKEIL